MKLSYQALVTRTLHTSFIANERPFERLLELLRASLARDALLSPLPRLRLLLHDVLHLGAARVPLGSLLHGVGEDWSLDAWAVCAGYAVGPAAPRASGTRV